MWTKAKRNEEPCAVHHAVQACIVVVPREEKDERGEKRGVQRMGIHGVNSKKQGEGYCTTPLVGSSQAGPGLAAWGQLEGAGNSGCGGE